jgi:hypothetical protein
VIFVILKPSSLKAKLYFLRLISRLTVDGDDDNYDDDNNNNNNNNRNLELSIYCIIEISDTEHYHTNNK